MSDLFIHAAKDEPWGVSVQEAIAGGCFVICSDKVGAAQDLLVSGKNGYTYQFGDVNQLAKYIEIGIGLEKEVIDQTNEHILSHWNYDLMWEEIKKGI
jgi:glycosyltransferase involved in cell wall biosynthesis